MRLKISTLLVFLLFLLMTSNFILFLASNSPIYALGRCKEWEPSCRPSACRTIMENFCVEYCGGLNQDCVATTLLTAFCVPWDEEGWDCACFSEWEIECEEQHVYWDWCVDHYDPRCIEQEQK